jgi:hypothetical protein
MLKQGVSVKEGGEPYTYVTETGETYEVHSVTFKFGKKVEVSPVGFLNLVKPTSHHQSGLAGGHHPLHEW